MKYLVLVFLLMFRLSLADVLTMASDPWPPYIGNNLPENGLAVHIANKVFEGTKYSVKYVEVPWLRAKAGVKDGTYDLLGASWYAEERASWVLYSEPFLSNKLIFVKHKNSNFEYNNLSDLNGMEVGIMKGYAYNNSFIAAQKFFKRPSNNLVQNLKLVAIGRLNVAVSDKYTAQYRINKELDEAYKMKLSFTKGMLEEKDLFFAVTKTRDDAQEIIELFNKGLKKLKENKEELSKIFTAHGLTYE